jgi:hypothetical protein
MPSQLLTYAVGHIAWLALVFGIVIGLKALAPIVQTWIVQASRSRRLDRALEGSNPKQRSEIILACSQLEGSATDEPNKEEVVSALAHPRLPVPILQGKRGRKRRQADDA